MRPATPQQKNPFWTLSQQLKDELLKQRLLSPQKHTGLIPEAVSKLPEHLLHEVFDSSQLVLCSLGWKLMNVFGGYLICFHPQTESACNMEQTKDTSPRPSRSGANLPDFKFRKRTVIEALAKVKGCFVQSVMSSPVEVSRDDQPHVSYPSFFISQEPDSKPQERLCFSSTEHLEDFRQRLANSPVFFCDGSRRWGWNSFSGRSGALSVRKGELAATATFFRGPPVERSVIRDRIFAQALLRLRLNNSGVAANFLELHYCEPNTFVLVEEPLDAVPFSEWFSNTWCPEYGDHKDPGPVLSLMLDLCSLVDRLRSLGISHGNIDAKSIMVRSAHCLTNFKLQSTEMQQENSPKIRTLQSVSNDFSLSPTLSEYPKSQTYNQIPIADLRVPSPKLFVASKCSSPEAHDESTREPGQPRRSILRYRRHHPNYQLCLRDFTRAQFLLHKEAKSKLGRSEKEYLCSREDSKGCVKLLLEIAANVKVSGYPISVKGENYTRFPAGVIFIRDVVEKLMEFTNDRHLCLKECFSLLCKSWKVCYEVLDWSAATDPSKLDFGVITGSKVKNSSKSPTILTPTRLFDDSSLSPRRGASRTSLETSDCKSPKKRKVSFAKELEKHGPDFDCWVLPKNYQERKLDSPVKIPKMFHLKRDNLLMMHKPIKPGQEKSVRNLADIKLALNEANLRSAANFKKIDQADNKPSEGESEQDSHHFSQIEIPKPSLNLNASCLNAPSSSQNTSRSQSKTPRVCLSGRELFNISNKLKPINPPKGESLRSFDSNAGRRSIDLSTSKHQSLFSIQKVLPNQTQANFEVMGVQRVRPLQLKLSVGLSRSNSLSSSYQGRIQGLNQFQNCQHGLPVLDIKLPVPPQCDEAGSHEHEASISLSSKHTTIRPILAQNKQPANSSTSRPLVDLTRL